MAKRNRENNKAASGMVGDRVISYLSGFGFPPGIARVRSAIYPAASAVITYDAESRGARRSYLTVVVVNDGATPPLLQGPLSPETRPDYLAFTDGFQWMWYQNTAHQDGFTPCEGPPPAPAMPAGGRWLEPVRDKRAFKQILRSMNVALRDSHGGGIVERFDVVSKVLFTKVFDEREVEEGRKDRLEFQVEAHDTPRSLSKRIGAMWHRACSVHESLFRNNIPELTQDHMALHKMVGMLQDISLLKTSVDIKGMAYEESLRNTFEKNENQQFFTPHEIAEFMVKMIIPAGNCMVCDPACGTGGFLVEYRRLTASDAKLVGADVDERLARVAQMNLIMHGAKHATIHYLPGMGSLAPLHVIAAALPASSCDLILTNPPFGSDLSDEVALREFEMGRSHTSRRRSVLFSERCLDLLRPGGRMAIVLDDSVLNLPSNSDARAMIMKRAAVEAIVSLPDVAFMPYSTAKSSILFLRKKAGSENQAPIFMAEANEVGRRPNGDPLYSDQRDQDGNRILLTELPAIVEAYLSFQQTGSFENPRCFVTPASLLDDRLDIYYYHPKRFAAEQEIDTCRWPVVLLRDLVVERRESVMPSNEFGDSPVRWLGLADIEEGTGEFETKVLPADKVKSAAHIFRGGDILFSKLRPNLRKVVLIPDDDEGGVCSSEIMVLRGHDRLPDKDHCAEGRCRPDVDSEYLAFMLRSDLIFGQLMYKVTGVGRPRVSPESVLSVKMPLPPLDEQKRIVSVFRSAWAQAVNARHEASVCLVRSRDLMNKAYERVALDLTNVSRRVS